MAAVGGAATAASLAAAPNAAVSNANLVTLAVSAVWGVATIAVTDIVLDLRWPENYLSIRGGGTDTRPMNNRERRSRWCRTGSLNLTTDDVFEHSSRLRGDQWQRMWCWTVYIAYRFLNKPENVREWES